MTRWSTLLGPIALVLICACSVPPDSDSSGGPRPQAAEMLLDYGPVLRSVDARSVRFLFHAARLDGTEETWSAGIEIGTAEDLGRGTPIRLPEVEVTAATDFVAHLTVARLEPQTRYTYVPLVNGRRAIDDPEQFPSFVTVPDLEGRNADFTVVWLADQHTPDGPESPTLAAYAAAAESRPLFWAQLGDVAASTLTPGSKEEQRTRADIQGIWRRNYGDRSSPQARFVGSHALNLATISDHELMDNFSMNWHRSLQGIDDEATLHDRVGRYDRSVETWWNYFGWGASTEDRLGAVARQDHGESVMAGPPVPLLEDASGAVVCVEQTAARGFDSGSFVYLVDDGGDAFHTRISEVGERGSCDEGRGTVVKLVEPAPRTYRRESGGRIAEGARYARHGHYGAYRPFPYVEFFLLDTTSYRGDPYQERELYTREANRDTDHSRYPWDAAGGRGYIFGDRDHGANRTTDDVRSWLGPTQKNAFLDALAGSAADVLVVAAGYPLHSAKFEWSRRYWEGRECGFDFASELDEIVAALEKTDKLVLWVHGDGHTPMLVQLRPNLYQLQVGPTLMGHTDTPGHRSRTLSSGDRSVGDSLGGGRLIAGHQPDLQLGDDNEDFFAGHLEQFEGYLRLHFHPGREALRNVERSGLRRGETDHVVEIPAGQDPARGEAGRLIVGRVVRLEFGERRRHSVVTSYGYDDGRARIELKDPVVNEDPDLLRVILDGDPWVEARWFDARGREWREFSSVFRKEP